MALTQVDQGLLGQYAQYTGFKNRIINGAMVIDQRNAGAAITPSSGQYSLDRWVTYHTQSSKYTVQQNAGSVTPPAGFTNYLGFTVGASANVTVGASDYFLIDQSIEGFNLADLAWGTASAQSVTLSFWVRSSLTGTFGGSVKSYQGTSWGYPFTYTINTANTWEQKTITIPGPTTTWSASTTNGGSAEIVFSMGTGSTFTGPANAWATAKFSATGCVNLISTNSATFYITGVQLEKGSTATSFDYRPYGTELVLCQRYFQKYANQPSAYLGNGNLARNGYLTSFIFPVKMRTAPTASNLSGSIKGNATDYGAFSSPSLIATADGLQEIYGASATGLNYGDPLAVYFTSIDLSAEL